MVKYLLDTDVLIDFINNKEEAVKLVKKVGLDSTSLSVITLAEFAEGLLLFPEKSQPLLEEVKQLKIYDVDLDIAEVFANQRFSLRKSGNLIDNMDLLIASTALTHNLTLVTNNQKDFKKIKSLKLYS